MGKLNTLKTSTKYNSKIFVSLANRFSSNYLFLVRVGIFKRGKTASLNMNAGVGESFAVLLSPSPSTAADC